MATVRDLIKSSLRSLGVIAAGETPSAGELSDSLEALNAMCESWSAEGLLVYANTREEFTLVPSQASYTLGSGGDFDSARPAKIDFANILFNEVEMPVRILTLGEWADVTSKSISTEVPIGLYVEGTAPLMTLKLYPVPSVAHKLVLYSQKPIGAFASANADIEFPPGYYEALKFNLCIRLAPEFGRPVSAEIASLASEAKANIERINGSNTPLLRTDAPVDMGMRANILAGR